MEGTEFGRYRLIELIGRGGMGEVWRAFDTVTERIVALKVLPAQYADDVLFQERFRREAKSAAALDEPHVVPIHDFGEIDGRLFVTMRLIKGRDLHGILREGRIDPVRAVGIVDQVASALHAAHQVDLVHRDVKPSNILVGDDDFAYLIDFGIARIVGQTSLTATSNVIGTWAYMAPERISAGQTDPRADTYALACVLYECLTGRQPFGGDSLEQQIGGHLTLPPPRASEQHADVPAELDAVIATGMAKSPDDRYANTRDFARAAKAAVSGPTTGPQPIAATIAAPLQGSQLSAEPTQYRPVPDAANPRFPKASRKKMLIALSSVGALVAIVAATVLFQSSDRDTPGAPPTSATPSALPNTGPFTGTFTAALGPKTGLDGSPSTNQPGLPSVEAYSETWRLRSVCGPNGCVATATTGGQDPVKDVVFDNVGGRWLAVTTARRKCLNRDDDEAWNVISLHAQPDGTLSGESTQITMNRCANKRTIVLTRTADTDISQLPDPAALPQRVTSPAEALHGAYDLQEAFAKGHKPDLAHPSVRADCLRNGDRCLSPFVVKPAGGVLPYIFANGTWTASYEFEDKCSLGGTMHAVYTSTMQLPQSPQDPIPLLTGHGYADYSPGTRCSSQAYDATFTRTGE